MRHVSCMTAAALAGIGCTSFASGAMIANGTYTLHNFPTNPVEPPPYGLRLDELYDLNPHRDRFTFDFDHPSSDMRMDVTDTTIRIYGVSYGGRDIGDVYADDIYRGIYTFDFTYNVGVEPVPGDDDIQVNSPVIRNMGVVTTPDGDMIKLEDKHNTGRGNSFLLGDDLDESGIFGAPGIAGWGWLDHGQTEGASDWIFTATIPTPGTAALFVAAAGLVSTRRR